jgi:hypothetical protein
LVAVAAVGHVHKVLILDSLAIRQLVADVLQFVYRAKLMI